MTRAAIGLGSNLDDPAANVERALRRLSELGTVQARSRFYRSKPWGVREQPDFCNAAAIVETDLAPRDLLAALQSIERDLGRREGPRWGPRRIDLDILLYGQERIDDPDLRVPHPRLMERAFALLPLAEIDPAFHDAAMALPFSERSEVVPMQGSETVAPMPGDPLIERIRALAQSFVQTGLLRLRIEERSGDAVELRRRGGIAAASGAQSAQETAPNAAPPAKADPVKADLVGIFHFSRPSVREGERLDADRELGYVEALGIRNALRSLGPGRISAVRALEGQAVEYGQVLFEIERV